MMDPGSAGSWWTSSAPFQSSAIQKHSRASTSEHYDEKMRAFLDGLCALGNLDSSCTLLESRDGAHVSGNYRGREDREGRTAPHGEDSERTGEADGDDVSVFSNLSAPDDVSVGSTISMGSASSISFDDTGQHILPMNDLLGGFRINQTEKSRVSQYTHRSESSYMPAAEKGGAHRLRLLVPMSQKKRDVARALGGSTTKNPENDVSLKTNKVSLMVTTASRGKFHRSVADKLVKIGDGHVEKAEFDKAMEAFQRAQNIYSVKIGDDTSESIDTRLKMGRAKFASGRHEEALDLFQHARNMTNSTRTGGKLNLKVADIWREISMVHKAKGQPAEALKGMKHALRSYKSAHGELHTSVADSAADVASLYGTMGNIRKALAIYSQVLKIRLQLYGKVHPDVAEALYELSVLHDENGDVQRAMKVNKKAYTIYNATVGGEHLCMANILSHFGHLYYKLGKTEKAFKAYGRALHIRKESCGRRHPLVADSLMDIGGLLRSEKQPKQSMQCMTEALGIYQACYGDDDVAVSDVMNVIGMIHYDEGENEAAMRMYKDGLDIRRRALGENHPSVANVLNNIGTVHSKNRNYDEAMDAYTTALNIYEKTTGKNHVKYAVTLVNIGTVLKNKGMVKEAKAEFTRALELCREGTALPEDHPVVQKATKSLEAINKSAKLNGNGQTERTKRDVGRRVG